METAFLTSPKQVWRLLVCRPRLELPVSRVFTVAYWPIQYGTWALQNRRNQPCCFKLVGGGRKELRVMPLKSLN